MVYAALLALTLERDTYRMFSFREYNSLSCKLPPWNTLITALCTLGGEQKEIKRHVTWKIVIKKESKNNKLTQNHRPSARFLKPAM